MRRAYHARFDHNFDRASLAVSSRFRTAIRAPSNSDCPDSHGSAPGVIEANPQAGQPERIPERSRGPLATRGSFVSPWAGRNYRPGPSVSHGWLPHLVLPAGTLLSPE